MERRKYIIEGRESIPGWFERADAELFDAIDLAQRTAGMVGDILEIGCYQGSSAILLGYLRRPNERMVVCDLFEHVATTLDDFHRRGNGYSDLSRESFEANFLRFHKNLPEIIAGPSAMLPSSNFGRTFRLIHVDGSHEYEIVRSDLLFDDIITLHTPGVTAAVWEGVILDGLIPVFQTHKLYGTWDDPLEVEIPKEFNQFVHIIHGHTMTHLEYPDAQRGLVARVLQRYLDALE
jgi:hypothetical protein